MSDPAKNNRVNEARPDYARGSFRTTDTTEGGLESIIISDMLASGWKRGSSRDYDVEYCVDLPKLTEFLHATQPEIAVELKLDTDNPARRAFLARLEKEIGSRGVIDVIRKGIQHQKHSIDLFYGTPSAGNQRAEKLYACNLFSVTNQLHYSLDDSARSLDMGIFINGLPLATFELKNSLTKQTVDDAVAQYRDERARNPRERIFVFGRCVVHFAVDDQQVKMCTHAKGKSSWFLPFNQGWSDGAGNPPNPNGLMTDYL